VVAFFSLEMSGSQVVQRLISGETGISSQRLRVGDIRDIEWDKFVKASGSLAEMQIFIDDTPSPSPMEIRTKCRRLAAEYGLDLIIIDYMQLMRSGVRSENRVQEVSYISRQLKGLARELNVPVIAISQLSRAVESRQDKRPILSDLRESGTIEQDADVVMFIYRDEMYHEDTENKNIAELIIAKHRNGPTGLAYLGFMSEQTRFVNLDRYHEDMGYVPELDVA
jgi:replicative DNA helicase